MIQMKSDTPQLIVNFYWLNRKRLLTESDSIRSAIFIGFRPGAEDNPIVADMLKYNVQIIRIEAWKDNCVACKDESNSIMINMDMRDMDTLFVPKSVDLIWSKHTLEHIPYNEVDSMLQKWKTIARKLVLAEVPKGEYKQGALYGNPFEEHKSALEAEDFKRNGFQHTFIGGYSYEELRHLFAIWHSDQFVL